MFLHHSALPCDFHCIAEGGGKVVDGEGGVVVVPPLPISIQPTISWWARTGPVVPQPTMPFSKFVVHPPAVSFKIQKNFSVSLGVPLFEVRPASVFSFLFHKLAQPVSLKLCSPTGRTQMNAACKEEDELKSQNSFRPGQSTASQCCISTISELSAKGKGKG